MLVEQRERLNFPSQLIEWPSKGTHRLLIRAAMCTQEVKFAESDTTKIASHWYEFVVKVITNKFVYARNGRFHVS